MVQGSRPGRGRGCERLRPGLLSEPASAVSSLVYLGAAALCRPAPPAYVALVAGLGVGSFVQHGPNPPGADLVHDLPLAGTLAFVAADCAADLSGRPRAALWWAAPTLALVPLVVRAPRAADTVQAGMATAAVLLALARARRRPGSRRRIGWALAVLGVGATIGTLSQGGGPLCDPESLLQGHAAWHVLSATALVVLAPVVGRRVRVSAA